MRKILWTNLLIAKDFMNKETNWSGFYGCRNYLRLFGCNGCTVQCSVKTILDEPLVYPSLFHTCVCESWFLPINGDLMMTRLAGRLTPAASVLVQHSTPIHPERNPSSRTFLSSIVNPLSNKTKISLFLKFLNLNFLPSKINNFCHQKI